MDKRSVTFKVPVKNYVHLLEKLEQESTERTATVSLFSVYHTERYSGYIQGRRKHSS